MDRQMEKKEVINFADEFIELTNVHGLVYAKEGGVIYLNELLYDFLIHFRKIAKDMINLSDAEMKSGLDRVKWAEGLIMQLPEDHEGRNSWLLNYGTNEFSVKKRNEKKLAFMLYTKSCQNHKY